jgi:DNA recombination protein RmuC
MNIDSTEFTLIILGAVIITALLVYLIISRSYTRKSIFEATREEKMGLSNLLEMEKIQRQQLEKTIIEQKEQIQVGQSKFQQVNEMRIAAQEKLGNLTDSLQYEREQHLQLRKEYEQNAAKLIDLNQTLAALKVNQQNLVEKLENQKKDFDEIRKRSLDEFKVAANALLEEKSERFAKFNKANIEQLLDPLGKNLDEFKKQVSETYDKEAKERFSLEGRIKELVELNNQISKDAQNLTNALKGQAKTQGDWGEMILENILEFSGLTKNREYFVQESFRDDAGNVKRPDVKVKYPDDRYIIIDSKVSLTAYERMTHTEDPDLFEIELGNHLKSIRTHIDELSAKEYDKFDKTLDFVMLFVPVEPAYMVAMQNDPGLWNHAYTKRILLISPTNLIAALKMVSDIWKRDDQNKNARLIASRGEMLYDKFVGFVDDLEQIEKHISRADDSWKNAMTKLKTGRGNLIGQAEKLRKLGLKPSKTLPGNLMPDEEE